VRALIDLRQELETVRARCDALAIFAQRYRPPIPASALASSALALAATEDDEFVEVPAKEGYEAQYGDDEEQARARARREGKRPATDDDDDKHDSAWAPAPVPPSAIPAGAASLPVPEDAFEPRPERAPAPVLVPVVVDDPNDPYASTRAFIGICSLPTNSHGYAPFWVGAELRATAPVVKYGPDLEVWTLSEQDLAKRRLAMGALRRLGQLVSNGTLAHPGPHRHTIRALLDTREGRDHGARTGAERPAQARCDVRGQGAARAGPPRSPTHCVYPHVMVVTELCVCVCVRG
jgi:hypothetical protein